MPTPPIFGVPRHTSEASFSGGSWQTAYPAPNLGILPLSMVARSTDATPASTKFVATFSAPTIIDLVVLVRHNISKAGTVRVSMFADPGMTSQLWSSGWVNAWAPIYGPGTLAWGDDRFWSLSYRPGEMAGMAWSLPFRAVRTATPNPNVPIVGYRVMAVLVEVSDPQNPVGYVEVGLCELSQARTMPSAFSVGGEYGFATRSVSLEADGGTQYFRRRQKPRTFSGRFEFVARDQALAFEFERQRLLDVDTPVFWWPYPDQPLHTLRTAFLARHAQLDKIALATRCCDTVPLSLIEVM